MQSNRSSGCDKKIGLILLLLIFTGCNKVFPLVSPDKQHSSEPTTLLVMGQSNAFYFPPAGTRPFYSKFTNVNVINCAVGSTSITQWTPNLFYYKDCIAQLQGKIPDIVYFSQGESDTDRPMGQTWAYQASQTFADLQHRYPHVKIFYAQIGQNNSGMGKPLWEDIQNDQASLFMPGVRMIVTKDLGTDEFGIHLTQEGYYTVGQRIVAELGLE